jgi:hypothetical protein
MSERDDDVTRRNFLTIGGLGALAAAFPVALHADWTAKAWTPAERENVKIVNEFLAGWEAADAVRLSNLLVEDGTARPTAHNQKEPPLKGRVALRDFAAKVFSGGTTVKF